MTLRITLIALLLGIVGGIMANTEVVSSVEVRTNYAGDLTIHRVMVFGNKVHHWGTWSD